MGILSDKVVLITGGSRGIGEGMVRLFVAEGAQVAFTYRSSADSAEKIISSLSGNVKAYKSDASSYDSSGELIKNVIQDFGRIDVLVNNAGITRDNLLMRMSEEQWDQVMETNLKSIFNLTKHIMRPMMKQRKGSIINISSVVGMTGNAGQSNYSASKAGIIGFTKSIAKEVGSRNIRCNAIAPGFIQTEMTDSLPEDVKKNYLKNIPLKRLGLSEEIAQVAAFLASDHSSYMTGQVLSVCGGLNC